MFSTKWLLFLVIGFGLLQAYFSMTEGRFQPGFSGADLDTVYKTHVVTITTDDYKISSTDVAARSKKSWINTVYDTASWRKYAILQDGFGQQIKQILLWPLTVVLLIGFSLTLAAHIPIIGRGS